MVYPGRPVLQVLPQFRVTATVKQALEQRQRLLKFVAAEYLRVRSLRELAELTGRTQTAIRRAREAGVDRRRRGEQQLDNAPVGERGPALSLGTAGGGSPLPEAPTPRQESCRCPQLPPRQRRPNRTGLGGRGG